MRYLDIYSSPSEITRLHVSFYNLSGHGAMSLKDWMIYLEGGLKDYFSPATRAIVFSYRTIYHIAMS